MANTPQSISSTIADSPPTVMDAVESGTTGQECATALAARPAATNSSSVNVVGPPNAYACTLFGPYRKSTVGSPLPGEPVPSHAVEADLPLQSSDVTMYWYSAEWNGSAGATVVVTGLMVVVGVATTGRVVATTGVFVQVPAAAQTSNSGYAGLEVDDNYTFSCHSGSATTIAGPTIHDGAA